MLQRAACIPTPLLFAFACGLFFTSRSQGQIEPVRAYTISPTSVTADKSFSLQLLTYNFNCANTYDMLSTSVNGNTISLTFLDHEGPKNSICPAIYAPYGPTFTLPALKPGTYKVTSYQLPACAPQGCKMAAMPSDAGELVVTGQATGKDNWYLKNNEVLASQKFTMQLLNQKYGNCQTGFSNQSVNVSADAISVQFLITTDPKVVCIMDVRPHGPTFEMAPLKLGKYPIYITELLPCEVKAPFCAVDRIRPTVSDTLIVSAALTTIIRGRAAATPTVRFEGRQLQLEMPESKNGSLGQGIWKTEVLTLSGQVRESHQFTVSAAGSIQLDIGTQIERGVYFIRLHAPSGETHTLPVVRKD